MKKKKAPLLLINGISKKKADMNGSKKRLNPISSMMKRKKGKVSGSSTYFHCSKKGYWKRNCKSFLAKMKENASMAHKGMYMIHIVFSLNSSVSNSWVLDTAYGSYICKLL